MRPHFLWQEPPPLLGLGKKEPLSRSGEAASLEAAAPLFSRPCLPTLVPVLWLSPWYRYGGQGRVDPSSTGPQGVKPGGDSSIFLFCASIPAYDSGEGLSRFWKVNAVCPCPSCLATLSSIIPNFVCSRSVFF